MRTEYTRNCARCDAPFATLFKRQWYCSIACANIAKPDRDTRPRVCVICQQAKPRSDFDRYQYGERSGPVHRQCRECRQRLADSPVGQHVLAATPATRRLWSDLSHEGDCWLFRGKTTEDGYGSISYRGESVGAHRLAYELAYGPIPDDLFVLHRCDHPSCVNPAHLFLGTHQDNMDDMVRKGRQAKKKQPTHP